MPFGLRNTPGIYQHCTSSVVKDLLRKCCCVYADDILCYSTDLKTFIDNVKLSRHISNENMECHLEMNGTRYDHKANYQQFGVGDYV